jgi:hypothetical protein
MKTITARGGTKQMLGARHFQALRPGAPEKRTVWNAHRGVLSGLNNQ